MNDRNDAPNGRSSDRGDAYRAHHDWTETTPSRAVIDALATVLECDPTDVGPLYDALDPDALDELLSRDADTGIVVAFTVEGFRVRVGGDGELVVRPDGGGADPT